MQLFLKIGLYVASKYIIIIEMFAALKDLSFTKAIEAKN